MDTVTVKQTNTQSPPPPYTPPQYATTHGVATATTTQVTQVGWVQPHPPPSYNSQGESSGTLSAGTTVISVATAPSVVTTDPSQTVLVLGNCPSCRVGFLRNEVNMIGIVLAILFFPIGLLCCLCMMDKRCSHCGASF